MANSTHEIEPVELLAIRITREDVLDAERFGIKPPLIYVLQRTTSTLWRISDCGVALEVTPPYRSCVISSQVLNYLRDHQDDENMTPYEFELQLRNI